jgi:hypothetical protein
MVREILFAKKTILIAIGLFLVFQILDFFLSTNRSELGLPLAYLHSGSSFLILVPDFRFTLIPFAINILWFYSLGVLAKKYHYGLIIVIVINLLIWIVVAQPLNINWQSNSQDQIKLSCEAQPGHMWVSGGVDSKGNQLIGTCQPLTR